MLLFFMLVLSSGVLILRALMLITAMKTTKAMSSIIRNVIIRTSSL